MPKKQVHDFDNPDQSDKDEYGLKSFSDDGDQEQLSPMKYRFQNEVSLPKYCIIFRALPVIEPFVRFGNSTACPYRKLNPYEGMMQTTHLGQWRYLARSANWTFVMCALSQ